MERGKVRIGMPMNTMIDIHSVYHEGRMKDAPENSKNSCQKTQQGENKDQIKELNHHRIQIEH